MFIRSAPIDPHSQVVRIRTIESHGSRKLGTSLDPGEKSSLKRWEPAWVEPPNVPILTVRIIGTKKVVPTPDFRISPGGRKDRKIQDNEE